MKSRKLPVRWPSHRDTLYCTPWLREEPQMKRWGWFRYCTKRLVAFQPSRLSLEVSCRKPTGCTARVILEDETSGQITYKLLYRQSGFTSLAEAKLATSLAAKRLTKRAKISGGPDYMI